MQTPVIQSVIQPVVQTEALVVTCIDYRLQALLDPWLAATIGHGNYNRVSFGGAVKNWDVIFTQVEMSKRVHKIKQVVLINHQDCRAYGNEDSHERHCHDLRAARDAIVARFPDLEVALYYLWLDGRYEPIE